MQILYPEIKPYAVHTIKVDPPHVLCVEECGTPTGIPVIFLHGGPGAGCQPYHRRFFDPSRFRVILFDQRGCGRSTPHAELKHNHTGALIRDIEKIRQHFGLTKVVLFGGSWGATLALAYAQAFPDRVSQMILRGIFLCRQMDLDWFYRPGGANRVFPDAWQKLLKPIPEADQGDLITAYYERLNGADDLVRMACAKAWSAWEGTCATLRPNHTVLDHFTEPHVALSLAKIETHYFMKNCFLADNQLLDNMSQIEHIPGVIVHGRYDMICPLEQALALHERWPASQLHIVRDAGHAAAEPAIVDALVRATDEIARDWNAAS